MVNFHTWQSLSVSFFHKILKIKYKLPDLKDPGKHCISDQTALALYGLLSDKHFVHQLNDDKTFTLVVGKG